MGECWVSLVSLTDTTSSDRLRQAGGASAELVHAYRHGICMEYCMLIPRYCIDVLMGTSMEDDLQSAGLSH